MQNKKAALTFSEQADQLLKRGLTADRDKLVSVLETISYYGLSAYWYPFRNQSKESFYPGTSLKKILNRYSFDCTVFKDSVEMRVGERIYSRK